MIRFSAHKISTRLASVTIQLALLVALAISTVQVGLDFREELVTRDETVDRILEVAVKSGARSVWLIDQDLAHEVVSGLLEYPFVFSATISDDLGNKIGSSNRSTTASSTTRWFTSFLTKELLAKTISLPLPPHVEGNPGRLELLIDNDIFLAPFYERVWILFLGSLMISITVALLMLVVANTLLARPLVTLADDLSDIDPEIAHDDLKPPKGHEKDELGLMVDAVNNMLGSIRALLSEQKGAQRSLARARDDLEEKVNERTIELQHEIKERQTAQDDLRNANLGLEKRVDERTKELKTAFDEQEATSRELMRMKEQADAANRAKTAFLANMSHELRTPLNAIIGFSSIMSQEMFGPVGNEKYQEYLSDIVNSGEHLSELLGNILDLAKVEAGELHLHEESVDVASMIASCMKMCDVMAGKDHIKLSMDIQDGVDYVVVDQTRTRQIIINLISNAIKFTPANGSVKTIVEFEDSGDLLFCVSDTGIGIPQDKLKSVLEPFVQVDVSYSKSHQGAGLGLALSRMLARLHGGELWIESEENVGTQVYFRLPGHRAHTQTKKQA